MRISSGPSTGMQLADKHTKKVAKSINFSICLMEQKHVLSIKYFNLRVRWMACGVKDLAFPKILLAMRTVMESFMSYRNE